MGSDPAGTDTVGSAAARAVVEPHKERVAVGCRSHLRREASTPGFEAVAVAGIVAADMRNIAVVVVVAADTAAEHRNRIAAVVVVLQLGSWCIDLEMGERRRA